MSSVQCNAKQLLLFSSLVQDLAGVHEAGSVGWVGMGKGGAGKGPCSWDDEKLGLWRFGMEWFAGATVPDSSASSVPYKDKVVTRKVCPCRSHK